VYFGTRRPTLFASPFPNQSLCYFCISGEGENELDRVVMAVDRQAAIQRQKEEAKKRRRKKKRTGSSLFASTFNGTILLLNISYLKAFDSFRPTL